MGEKTVAVVFPGQGSQRPGMGKDFYDEFPICRESYEEASDSVGWNIAAMCFEDDERLNLTEYTQPCILTTEIAMLRSLQKHFGFMPVYFGGHSLGEFTALVASGVLSLSDAVRVVQFRGRLMQEAVPVGVGTMAAIISDTIDVEMVRLVLQNMPVDVANINSLHQIVVSGETVAVIEAENRLRNALGEGKPFRYVILNVSAPFHSRFMDSITGEFEKVLTSLDRWRVEEKKSVVVTSNFTGEFHTGVYGDLIFSLVSQLNHPVQWVKNMKALAACSDVIYEVGPGRPLKDFFKSVNVLCTSITTVNSARRALGGIEGSW